jgi:hypothetical protein
MKSRVRAISALLIIAFLTVPSLAAGEQLAVPMERTIFPGVTTIQYADQTLVFTTTDPLKIKLSVVPEGHVQLSFKKAASRTQKQTSQQSSVVRSGGHTVIFWEQAGENVFNGTAGEGWSDVPLTEGGWTEK